VLWREEVIALHKEEFSDVELSHLYVDNAAMQIVREPAQFDVMVTGNIFGDILSIARQWRRARSACCIGFIGARSTVWAVARRCIEPVHGSAPDIAGRESQSAGLDPQVAMMLRMTLKPTRGCRFLEKAVDAALRQAPGPRIRRPGAKNFPPSRWGMRCSAPWRGRGRRRRSGRDGYVKTFCTDDHRGRHCRPGCGKGEG